MPAKTCPRGTRNVRGRCVLKEDIVKQKVTLSNLPGSSLWQVQKIIIGVERGDVISVRKSDVVEGKSKALKLKKEWSKTRDPEFRKWMI